MGLDVVSLHRLARQAKGWGIPVVPALLRKAIFYLHSSWVPAEVEIGEGTVFGYGGLGVVLHAQARIGRHCLISQHVTIGGRSGHEGAPVIGDYVRIGAGAQVLGKVRVADYAVIGANAVVIHDVAPGAVVAGVPARELRRDPEPMKSYLREHTAHRLEADAGGRNVIVP